jgi:hypothetical protein
MFENYLTSRTPVSIEKAEENANLALEFFREGGIMEQKKLAESDLSWKLINPVGIIVTEGTHTDCWVKLLEAQTHSAHYATTYEGWKLVPETKGRVRSVKRDPVTSFGIYKGCLRLLEG